MEYTELFGKKLPTYRCDALIIGTGCAGFNAADTLYDLGVRDIVLVTEGVDMGTSRNTGSDKQTYYKLAVQSGEADSVTDMAKTLSSGGDVHGDIAYAEAVNSIRAFMKLVYLGVPFPTNEYGEFVGYQTDHTNTKRATSAGPLTSKYMTECLESQVEKKNISVIDKTLIVEILTNDSGVYGAVGFNKQNASTETHGFVLFLTPNIIAATGGPAAVYQNRVYPPSQTGMSGMLLNAGASFLNLQEWQYGIASKSFRWNLSGTYQQVLPRYVSIDAEDIEHEFLPDYFDSATAALDLVFLKGYQWPFDSAKLKGSSMIDMAVYREEMLLGRKVYLDFTKDPMGLEQGFEALSEETYSYLSNSNALLKTPIARLRKMNSDAIELYMSHGIDLEHELLPISVSAQHCNGGVAVDVNWQTNVEGLYVVGEAAGTFGAYRPGGSALNSCQVGSMRAAEHIAQAKRKPSESDIDIKLSKEALMIADHDESSKAAERVNVIGAEAAKAMSAIAAHIRISEQMPKLQDQLRRYICELDELLPELPSVCLGKWFQVKDQLATQIAMLEALLFSSQELGSHGGAICLKGIDDTLAPKEYLECVRCEAGSGKRGMIAYSQKNGVCMDTPRPMPQTENWFENVWAEYKKRRA